MVHWPETMVTWCAEAGTLFSGDAFGTFGAIDGGITDSQIDPSRYWDEMRRYYACIVGKYGGPVQKALAKVRGLNQMCIRDSVSSLNRLFPVDTRNEERTRAAGLHRWYELQFDTEVDLDLAAQKLSAVAEAVYKRQGLWPRLVGSV